MGEKRRFQQIFKERQKEQKAGGGWGEADTRKHDVTEEKEWIFWLKLKVHVHNLKREVGSAGGVEGN